jgi:excisionase family DNA binding protein
VASDTPSSPKRGLTVREAARYLRLGRDTVRGLIRRGELGAVDTAPRGGRPRLIILPHHLAEWERSRRATAPAPPSRRRKRAAVKDYYPD